MKIAGWLIFVALNFWLLFFYTKTVDRRFLIRGFILTIPAACVITILLALGLKLIHFYPSQAFTNSVFSVFFSFVILSMLNLGNQLFQIGLDGMASFHEKNNAENINRQPIKLLITKRPLIRQVIAIIWFLGSALMLYGAWFDMHVQ